MNSRAIPTRYKGCLFRSRNEARWAVFFETMGIRWTHEAEGFRIPNYSGYLPDFYVEEWHSWVEIKSGDPSPEERVKCRLLSDATNQFVLLLAGEPYPHVITRFCASQRTIPGPMPQRISLVPDSWLSRVIATACGLSSRWLLLSASTTLILAKRKTHRICHCLPRSYNRHSTLRGARDSSMERQHNFHHAPNQTMQRTATCPYAQFSLLCERHF
jgi:hypothetical protein